MIDLPLIATNRKTREVCKVKYADMDGVWAEAGTLLLHHADGQYSKLTDGHFHVFDMMDWYVTVTHSPQEG